MKKVFTIASTERRHDTLHDFLIKNNYVHDQAWESPALLPLDSYRSMDSYIRGGCAKVIPDVCIIDICLHSNLDGEKVFDQIKRLKIFSATTPVVYLIQQHQSIMLHPSERRYVRWGGATPFEEIECVLKMHLDEVFRVPSGHWADVVAAMSATG